VLARETIRTISGRHGWRCSFHPPLTVGAGGDCGRLRLSVWRNDRNLLADGDGPNGMTRIGEALAAGVLAELPGLMAFGAPTENERPPIRFIDGRATSAAPLAAVETTAFSQNANPEV
jgi:glutamine synthetase